MRLPLYQKDRPPHAPATRDSAVLLRLGERCDHDCPMCSNAGRRDAQHLATDELIARVDRIADLGFGGIFVTGGEPTIHPGFFPVVERARARALGWQLNTHGRRFADGAFADRAAALGLVRAFVSLHGPDAATSATMSGTTARAFDETARGIEALLARRVPVVVCCVLARPNLDRLVELVALCAARFVGARLKLAFPSPFGRGGAWPGIDLALDEVRAPLAAARAAARAASVELLFEALPACVVGDPDLTDAGRSGSGETHYLDESGTAIFSMAHVEAELSRYGGGCLQCRAFARCPGVNRVYAERRGTGELTPFDAR